MKWRLTYFAMIVVSIVALTDIIYRKIGPERLMLWYYQAANNVRIRSTEFLSAIAIILVLIFFMIRSNQKSKKKIR